MRAFFYFLNCLEQANTDAKKMEIVYAQFPLLSQYEQELCATIFISKKQRKIISLAKLGLWVEEKSAYPPWLIEKCKSMCSTVLKAYSLILKQNNETKNIARIEHFLKQILSKETDKKALIFDTWDKLQFEEIYWFNSFIIGNIKCNLNPILFLDFLSKYFSKSKMQLAYTIAKEKSIIISERDKFFDSIFFPKIKKTHTVEKAEQNAMQWIASNTFFLLHQYKNEMLIWNKDYQVKIFPFDGLENNIDDVLFVNIKKEDKHYLDWKEILAEQDFSNLQFEIVDIIQNPESTIENRKNMIEAYCQNFTIFKKNKSAKKTMALLLPKTINSASYYLLSATQKKLILQLMYCEIQTWTMPEEIINATFGISHENKILPLVKIVNERQTAHFFEKINDWLKHNKGEKRGPVIEVGSGCFAEILYLEHKTNTRKKCGVELLDFQISELHFSNADIRPSTLAHLEKSNLS